MAIADNIFTGGAGTGNLATTGNWTVAIAADQNLIFPADAPTTYTLTGDLSATAVNSVINLSNCNFGAASAAGSHTFIEADISVGNNTITKASHGLITGQTIVFTTTGTLPAELTPDTTYYVIFASSSTYKVATSLANAIAGTAIDFTDDGDTGTHTAKFHAYASVKFNVGSVFSGHSNLFDDYGTGIRYLNVKNAANVNIQGRGMVELGGITNTTLRINGTGTATVGPVPADPFRAETVALIAGNGGTVSLENVTKADGTAVPITKIDGQVNLKTYSRLATVNQYGGTWRHYDNGVLAHQSGVVAAIYQQAGATLYYNSTGALTLIEAAGTVDFSTEDMRAKTVTTGKFSKGAIVRDPNGVVTWSNPFQTPFCALKDVTIDVGTHRKYDVYDI